MTNGNQCPNGHMTMYARGDNLGCTSEKCNEPERCPEGHVTVDGCTRAECRRHPVVDLRVAFTGASGTGKTTLARHVAERFRLPLNPVGARSVAAAMGFASPYDVDKAGRRAEFQRRLIADKMRWEREHDAFVTDRTPFDNLAYTALHDVACIDAAMRRDATRGYWRYDVVVHTPVEVFIETGGDAARVKNPEYHNVFEAVLLGFIRVFGLTTHEHRAAVAGFVPLLVAVDSGVLSVRKSTVDRALLLAAAAKPRENKLP